MSIRTKRVTRSTAGNFLMVLFLALAGLFMALPIAYSLINSFKPVNELFIYPPRFWVNQPTVENYIGLFRMQVNMMVPFERYVFNSVFVSLVTTAAYVLIAALAAYPMAKLPFVGRGVLLSIVVWAILFRPEVTAIPQYMVMSKMGLVDTYGALIFPALATSFGVFLMRQFMTGIPEELLEAARIDGCSEYAIFWRIVMQLVRPAWLTLVIFTFQSIWNTTGIQFIYTENLKMLPTALSQISTAGIARAGMASAISVLLMLPPTLIFIISQHSVIETMAYSGLKE